MSSEFHLALTLTIIKSEKEKSKNKCSGGKENFSKTSTKYKIIRDAVQAKDRLTLTEIIC